MQAELLSALKSTKNDKSPGSDGFTAEFYKMFWVDIKEYLLASINCAFERGELSITQKNGIITLLPKKGKENLLLKNWRPISLLNQDYKLIAKCIASRIRKYLPHIIHRDQTGFMKNRYIGENINRILSIMDMADENDLQAVIVLIDFEKAFDSLEWEFIDKTLKYFNFGENMRKWVKTLYKGANCSVINNGWTSQSFSLQRGVRQGCPLSPYLFLLAAEILATKVREDTQIQGISIDGQSHKISQFADDTSMSLLYSPDNINRAFHIFDDFEQISGLKVNYDKTEIFPIGALAGCKTALYKDRHIKWASDNVKLLGIVITHDKRDLIEMNYRPILSKMENLIKIWNLRKLSLYGKVTIIKTQLQSQLIYQLSVLPSPHKNFLNQFERLMFKFLWDSKPDKIKRVSLYGPKHEGGLSMPDVANQNIALKVAWVKRLINAENSGWASLVWKQLPPGGLAFFQGNMSETDVINNPMTPKNPFWNEVLVCWAKFNYSTPETKSDILSQSLWYSSYIKINKKLCSGKHGMIAALDE